MKLRPSRLKLRLQTCASVSIDLRSEPSLVFHTLMDLSCVPPPETSMPESEGDQASALMAAVWCFSFQIYLFLRMSQTYSLFSLPPEASWAVCLS